MNLKDYQEKRQFSKTPEPEPETSQTQAGQAKTELVFVVQEHQATKLHWDFRLEMDGVLKSWAVPKGVPKKAGIKRLAVQTEDHPLGYADFQGTIPQGEYGAGTVKIWDQGSYQLVAREDDLIEVKLKGKKLNGSYVLVQPKSFAADNWLIFKKKERVKD